MRFPNGTFRKLRELCDEPGVAHELTFSCYKKLKLLDRDRTRNWFLDSLQRAAIKHDFELWAYVIMPDHAHVLLCPRQPNYNTGLIRQSIKQPVARRAINWLGLNNPEWLLRLRRTDQSGRVHHHFWQPGGGYDRNIVKLATIKKAVDYIHYNPVRRGIVSNPMDWIWSSARFYDDFDDSILNVSCRPLMRY